LIAFTRLSIVTAVDAQISNSHATAGIALAVHTTQFTVTVSQADKLSTGVNEPEAINEDDKYISISANCPL